MAPTARTPDWRLERAMVSAVARVEECIGQGGDVFAALGECLFWISAVATARGVKAPLLHGLQWARNAIAHGHAVTAPVDIRNGAVLGRIQLGRDGLGEGPSARWLRRSEITYSSSNQSQDADYDAEVAGQDAARTLRAAMDLLL